MSLDLSDKEFEWLKKYWNKKGMIPIKIEVHIRCLRLKKVLIGYTICKKCEHFVKIESCAHTCIPIYLHCNYKF